jgi:iron complex outermembrane receptor protein
MTSTDRASVTRQSRCQTLAGARTLTAILLATSSAAAFAQAAADPAPLTQAASDVAADQPADADAAGASAKAGEIVVTGSRVNRIGFEAPTPVTAITQQNLELKAARNVSDLLVEVPALRGNQNSQRNDQPAGASNLDLRGLGSSRTLLLVDGRRFASTSPGGGVDVNVLPAPLIRQLEIVTGGASAAYGSDAVSGVVNISLDTKFKGLKGDVQYGFAENGGYRERGASLTGGLGFAEGRGSIVLSGEIYRNSGESEQSSRDWGNKGWAVLTNPGFVAGSNNGQPRLVIAQNARFSRMTDGGVITSAGPLQNLQFGPGGTLSPFRRGTYVGSVFMSGGDGGEFWSSGNLYPKVSRESGFGHATFDFSDHVTGFVEGLYAHSKQFYDIVPSYNSGDITIRRDNAFLPAAVASIMDANRLTSFVMGRTNRDTGFLTTFGENRIRRVATGLNGDLGGTWKWDTYGQYSWNSSSQIDGNNRLAQNWLNAIDAVAGPGGKPICRSTIANPNNGCAPVNLFGPNTVTPDVQAYAFGDSSYYQLQKQLSFAANLNGEPFSTWAGPVSTAIGYEFRREQVRGTSDERSRQFLWRAVNPQPISGKINVNEVYFETVVPLAKDMSWAKTLELNGAVRLTDYSTSGRVTTWKAGLNYSPVDAVRFRGTVSRDIRAANISELFSPQVTAFGTLIDPFTNQNLNIPQYTGGNPDLNPEVARTYTAGVVLEPHFLTGFRTAIDVYDITINDAITALSGQQVVDRCFAGQTDLCGAIVRDAGGTVTSVFSTRFNAQQLKTRGLDVEAAYRTKLGAGSFSARVLANYVKSLETINNGISVDNAGAVVAGVPHWRVNLEGVYQIGTLTVRSLVRYVQGGLLNATYVEGVDIDDNTVPGRTYVDASFIYRMSKNVSVFGKVENLFDKDPPITTSSLISPQAASSVLYDVRGRYMSVGARFAM